MNITFIVPESDVSIITISKKAKNEQENSVLTVKEQNRFQNLKTNKNALR